VGSKKLNIILCSRYTKQKSQLIFKYSNPSVYEQSVSEFSLIRDAQINTCFSIYKSIFTYTTSFLLQTDHCSWRLFSGSNGKLICVLRVFTLRAVLEEQIKLINQGIPVYSEYNNLEIPNNVPPFSNRVHH
jgi:hypothetical protein